MGTGWDDLELEAAGEGRFTTSISDPWRLAIAPQGGIVTAVAVRAMARVLGHPEQRLRTVTAMFAGVVHGGPVTVDVQVLRRGRSMSQLTATVRNDDADAGLTAIAAFGASRRGFDFTELAMPAVDGPGGLLGYRDPIPEGVDFTPGDPFPFWDEIVECRPAIGRPPWEPHVAGPAEAGYWYRLDEPPLSPDGRMDVAATIVLCDTMPGSVGQKLGPDSGQWFAPSVDYTLHVFRAAPPGWLFSHQRARHAGDGYASVDSALWDPQGDDGRPALVAYATQVMLFTFP
ncbi:MAG: thioesterase family protein [Acidimicrobiales bacterium]